MQVEQGIRVAERSYDAEPRSHHHAFCQVLLPAQGRLTLACGDERGWVGGGQVAIIAPGVEHEYHADGPNCVVVTDLPAHAPEVAPVLDRPGAFWPQDARLTNLTATLQAETRSGGLRDPLVADALLRYLVAALATVEPEGGRGAPAARRAVAAAQAYAREHYQQPLTVAEVAAAAGVSASHLHRSFRAETGSTLVAFVHGLRLAAAAALLRDTDETVLAVAHAVGFASQSHLTRLFTRQFGCAPGRYRAQARGR